MLATPETYAAYRAELEATRLPESVRSGILLVIVLSSSFIALDYVAHRDHFWSFLAVRLATNVGLGAIYLFLTRTRPVLSAIVGCYVLGGMLLFVIYATGGVASDYYTGLVLMFSGVPVVVPLSARQSAWVVTTLTAAFAVSPLVLSAEVAWRTYALHIFFPLGSAVVCVASCAVLDRMRFNDFLQRQELERARDELAEMDRAKSRFTANVHHELRTPLTLMLAPLDAIRSGDFGDVPERIQATLRTMQSNGLRLLKLINNLLDLAKAEGEQLKVRRVQLDVGRLATDLVEGARPMAERKRIALVGESLDGLPLICADPEALEKILVNLIGNALKFTDEGSVTVAGQAVDGGGLRISVRDTGAGIPAEQVERIFDRFAQVDTSATRRHEGTGIGLSLVRELVELHDGRVWAESEGEGEGATVHVELPRGEADADEGEEVLLAGNDGRALSAARSFEALASELALELDGDDAHRLVEVERSVDRWAGERTEARDQAPRQHPPGTPEVVIAEDNVEMRRLLAFLVGQEFVVRACRNGREALESVRERAPTLVLTDVMMPEMSGTELCRALKSDPETQSVPVVLVTSKAEREMKIEGLELGADDYVTKPFHPRELMARVRSLVRIRELQQEVAARNESLAENNAQLERALRDLKEAEVQLVHAERLAAVGELSAGVAHEVNNPLNFARNSLATLRTYVDDVRSVVQGVADLDLGDRAKLEAGLADLDRLKQDLGFDDLAEGLAELVAIVTEGLDRTSRLVADLRDFAAPHRGSQAQIDVAAGLRSTLQLLGHRLREAGAQVDLSLAEGLPPVEGDPGGLNQVFLNLLKNAAEAIEGTGGTIRVVASRGDMGVEVRITDDGPGIGDEAHGKLFEPFFTTKEAGLGTGLGLSICKRIVEEHAGTIAVHLAAERGTEVVVTLPSAAEVEDDR